MDTIEPVMKLYLIQQHIFGTYIIPRYKRNSVKEYRSILEMFAKGEKSNSIAERKQWLNIKRMMK